MRFLISWSIFLFALIPRTNGINCISCVGWSNSGCNDPYDESTSGDLPVPGNTYCLKVVYPTYVERMAGGRTCTAGAGVGSSVRYCCSDTDYCNRANLATVQCTRCRFPHNRLSSLMREHLVERRIYIYEEHSSLHRPIAQV
ncbi:unnamed protein product [Rotaria socialis]|uniref:Uncharacterized protein n=1 Tax=Rotaria socialis TaxID=392032 RepID=A0A817RHA3_9BILA|nr:unnamed protein product [Rotaria socialis]